MIEQHNAMWDSQRAVTTSPEMVVLIDHYCCLLLGQFQVFVCADDPRFWIVLNPSDLPGFACFRKHSVCAFKYSTGHARLSSWALADILGRGGGVRPLPSAYHPSHNFIGSSTVTIPCYHVPDAS